MEKNIVSKSINGVDWIEFIYNPETGLYHFDGDKNYAGYTEEELEDREWMDWVFTADGSGVKNENEFYGK